MQIELLEANLSHENAYMEIFSSNDVCRYTDILPLQTLDDSRKFLEISEEKRKDRKLLRYSIVYERKIVGTICLYSIYWHQSRASIGYALSQNYWNKGLMTEAVCKIEGIARNELNLNRLQATIIPENFSSKKVLDKRGFLFEGLLKQYEFWEGRGFVDLEMYSKILC